MPKVKVDAERKRIATLSARLQEMKRQRDVFLKSRIMIENRLASATATLLGYASGMDEAERKKHWECAKSLVQSVAAGESVDEWGIDDDTLEVIHAMIVASRPSLDSFEDINKRYMKRMEKVVVELPVWKNWGEGVRCLGALSLGKIVGETGDLFNYANPAKVWKRMGCAPYEKNGVTKMPKTWKAGGLTAEDWVTIGYCGRRRSVIYTVAEGLMKGNRGEYRDKYDTAKADAADKHEDWTKGHCHNHALLLVGKKLLLDLWVEWTGVKRGA